MSLPFGNPDTTFESFLQELPADYAELAREFKAFAQSRKIKTPAQLLQVVMSICGVMAPAIFAVMAPPQGAEIRGSNDLKNGCFFAPFATGGRAGGDRGLGLLLQPS